MITLDHAVAFVADLGCSVAGLIALLALVVPRVRACVIELVATIVIEITAAARRNRAKE